MKCEMHTECKVVVARAQCCDCVCAFIEPKIFSNFVNPTLTIRCLWLPLPSFQSCYCIIKIISIFLSTACPSDSTNTSMYISDVTPHPPAQIHIHCKRFPFHTQNEKWHKKHSFSHSLWIFTAYFFFFVSILWPFTTLRCPSMVLPRLLFSSHLLPFSHCRVCVRMCVCRICCVSKSIGCDSYQNTGTSTLTALKAIFIHIIFGKMHTSSRLAPCIWCSGETWNWNVSFNLNAKPV